MEERLGSRLWSLRISFGVDGVCPSRIATVPQQCASSKCRPHGLDHKNQEARRDRQALRLDLVQGGGGPKRPRQSCFAVLPTKCCCRQMSKQCRPSSERGRRTGKSLEFMGAPVPPSVYASCVLVSFPCPSPPIIGGRPRRQKTPATEYHAFDSGLFRC